MDRVKSVVSERQGANCLAGQTIPPPSCCGGDELFRQRNILRLKGLSWRHDMGGHELFMRINNSPEVPAPRAHETCRRRHVSAGRPPFQTQCPIVFAHRQSSFGSPMGDCLPAQTIATPSIHRLLSPAVVDAHQHFRSGTKFPVVGKISRCRARREP